VDVGICSVESSNQEVSYFEIVDFGFLISKSAKMEDR
jgi:hypothetical protein